MELESQKSCFTAFLPRPAGDDVSSLSTLKMLPTGLVPVSILFSVIGCWPLFFLGYHTYFTCACYAVYVTIRLMYTFTRRDRIDARKFWPFFRSVRYVITAAAATLVVIVISSHIHMSANFHTVQSHFPERVYVPSALPSYQIAWSPTQTHHEILLYSQPPCAAYHCSFYPLDHQTRGHERCDYRCMFVTARRCFFFNHQLPPPPCETSINIENW